MDGKNFINRDEMLKSVDLINGYVQKEENLLNNIVNSLRDGFQENYNSINATSLRGTCYKIDKHCSVVVDNNKKISQTFIDVINLYERAALRSVQKLEEIKENFNEK